MTTLRNDDPVEVGPYRIIRRLGGGGMGQVYLAVSRGGRPVAVKVVRAALAGDPAFRARFRAEVAAARAVGGVFTASVVDADPEGPSPWLATEYVSGPSLQEAIELHGPMPEGALRVLGAGLAEALRAVHEAGVVHRDLKPSNVLLSADGPRVIDFGISRALGGASLTATGQVVGSAGYMPPEQVEGRPAAPAGDVFSLGAVLVFAATAQPPFGTGPAPVLLFRTVHERPRLDGVPAGLAGLLARCLDKDPARRPPVERLPELLSTPARSRAWLPEPMAQDVRRREATLVDELPAPPGPLTRRRLLAAGAGLGAATAVTGGALWAFRRNTGPRLPRPLWRTTLPAADVARLSDTTLGGIVHYGNRDTLIAFDVATGRRRWTDTGGPYVGSPVIDERAGNCLMNVGSRIRALDAVSGAERWSYDVPARLRPAKDDDYFLQAAGSTVYLWTFEPYRLFAVDSRQGAVRWSFTDSKDGAGMVYGGGEGYVIYQSGVIPTRIRCLDPASGRQRWVLSGDLTTSDWNTWGDSADRFFCHDEGRDLVAVRLSDGATAWKIPGSLIATKGEGYRFPSLQVLGGSLLLSGSNHIRLIDMATGHLLWACQTTSQDASPQPLKNAAYYLDADVVHRVDLRTGRSTPVTGRLPASSSLASVTDDLLITSVVDETGGRGGLYGWDAHSGKQVWNFPAKTENKAQPWQVSQMREYLIARYEQSLFAFHLS
ncbi:PQQ-binding-like beta-propeller repeat protein [Actinoallomurus sp. NPDC052308]|uniref:protein kinase domain-containing protein n=1 Tax=Actinoallomurus sp. NPDC052308 TaxID=3155530 RepID=UPI003444CF44